MIAIYHQFKGVRQVTVYVDLLFVLNLVINTLVLAGALALSRERMHLLRLICAGAVGAFYSVLVFFPETNFLFRALLRFLVSVVMVAVGIPTPSLRRFLKALLWFYICLGAFAGGMYLFYSFTSLGAEMVYSGGVYYVDMPLWLLLAVSFAFYGFIRLASFLQCRSKPLQTLEKIEICIDEKYRTLIAFVDTGNHLIDPLTLSPVVLVEASALTGVLPPSLIDAVKAGDSGALESLCRRHAKLKCRLIPFRSIEKSGGMIFAVRPDWIRLVSGGQYENVLLGLCATRLGENYQALLPEKLQ